MRRSRWRPVCPECGYSIRGLVRPRCPECGVDFPSPHRSFRRWAIQRTPWDRARRGSLATAYLATLLRVLFAPWSAGRRIAVPDRWGRAIRWALAHLLLGAAAATLLSNDQYYPWWLVEKFRPSPFYHPAFYGLEPPPVRRVIVWFAESLMAWTVLLASFPAVGVLVSLGMPGRHRAAKLTGAKWSLYVTPVLLVALSGWYIYHFAYPQARYYGSTLRPTSEPIFFVFAAWWAVGLTLNPYDKSWRVPAVVFLGVCFGVLSWAVTEVLFPGGALEALL